MHLKQTCKATITLTLLLIHLLSTAQVQPNIQVDKLSDKQVEQIVEEINSRGLTMEQAIQLAKARGASSLQIDQLQSRIQKLQMGGSELTEPSTNQASDHTTYSSDSISTKTNIQATDKNKKIYGFNLFNANNLTFEPSINIPAPDNYVVGNSDQLTINIWGASQQTYQLRVDGNGNIQIPDLGPVHVGGMNFNQAERKIIQRLQAIYSGMSGENPNTFASVSINNLRSIKVNVVGEVNAPGTYTLPATASAFNALYLSGGPNENGSFRQIKVLRQNKEVATIDVYNFLIHGKISNNVSLRDQDLILIPTYEKRVELSGAFKREGYFELTEQETLADLISYAGGFTDQAYQERLTITRTTGRELKVVDVTRDNFDHFILQNGDLIEAGEIIDRYENRVSIEGAVFRPGTYALTDGMQLSDLIRKADGVKENVFSNRGVLLRLGADLTPQTTAFNVSEIVSGDTDIALKREDQVIIKDIFSMRESRFVRIFGQVQNPGEYEYLEQMSLKDLIFLSGGFTEAASSSFIELARRHDHETAATVTNQLSSLFQFDISRDLELDQDDATFELKPFDYIYVRKAPSYNQQRTVTIQGEVVYPGPYSLRSKTERISDLIKRSGGLTPQAFSKGAILQRQQMEEEIVKQSIHAALDDSLTEKAQEQLTGYRKLELRLADIMANPGSLYDYILREGDQIIVPEEVQEVSISGEVLNPIGLAYQPNKSLKYYINRSGGFSSDAKKGKVFVIYSDGTTKVTKGLFNRSYPKPEPGSQIVVPSKPERPQGDNTSKWLAIASTFSSLAVAVAALLR
ncbi:SLBB domain-containing protein [Sunxiuqinia indica]|uniref:SLBB domain-containing protein n=1 Tax=Sunxiuqinia indica TaxID=2692584 RepID=UPI0013599D86|nr:SLBB domain-containing protein [Sunxiuqinia indica]